MSTTIDKIKNYATSIIERVLALEIDNLRERVEKLEQAMQPTSQNTDTASHDGVAKLLNVYDRDRVYKKLEETLAEIQRVHDLLNEAGIAKSSDNEGIQLLSVFDRVSRLIAREQAMIARIGRVEKERDHVNTELTAIRNTLINLGVADTSEGADGNYLRSTPDMVNAFAQEHQMYKTKLAEVDELIEKLLPHLKKAVRTNKASNNLEQTLL